jgi:hypothetical protein
MELEQEGEENGQHGAKKFCGEWMPQKSRRSKLPCTDSQQAKTRVKNRPSPIFQVNQLFGLERFSAKNTAPRVVAAQKLKNKHTSDFIIPTPVSAVLWRLG